MRTLKTAKRYISPATIFIVMSVIFTLASALTTYTS